MTTLSNHTTAPAAETGADAAWQARRAGNLKLAWVLVGVVLAVFVIALFRFRPL